jgi:heat shock protein HslJ
MKKLIWILAMIAIVALLAGCSQGGKLVDTNWKLTTLNGQAGLPDATPTVLFGPDGKLAGTTGCNQYSGTYEIKGKTLTIQVGPMTMMACPEPVMKQEQDFLAALKATNGYKVDNDKLTLNDADGKELATFLLMSPAALQDTLWMVTSLNNGKEAVVSVPPEVGITATFQSGGILTGFAGCNTYNAVYVAAGNKITIEKITSTKVACPQALNDQEAAYLAALAKAATYEMGADTLDLRDANGALQVSYKSQ